MQNAHPVIAPAEVWTIPTYPVPAVEEMPMFAELRGHQGTSGNPYPSRVVQKVDREHRADRDYTVVRLENDYIRVCILPELGGRIFEAYDKVNDYHFLYRQHVINAKLAVAKQMLADTRMRVEDIAYAIGYENYISFYNVFRKMENMSPTEYRFSKCGE